GLGQVAGIGGEFRAVVGAGDVDVAGGQRCVGRGYREGVAIGGAGDELVVRRARRVGPGAGGVDREAAVAAGGGGLGNKGGRAVDVADGQRAGGRDVGRRVGLGDRKSVVWGESGDVGAGGVGGDRGQRAASAARDGGADMCAADVELVVRRARRVGPGAGGVDREAAVAAGGGGLGNKGGRAVDVADGQRAGGRDVGRRVGL